MYVLVLASKFIEFPSAVIVAESNKVTHSIRCAIYGNTTLVSKRTKNNKRRNDFQKQGLKHECGVSSTYNTANLATNYLSPFLRQVSVCIHMCMHVRLCMYVFAYVYRYVHTRLCVHVHIWVHLCVHVYRYVHTCMSILKYST